jgi:hypothetical protein
MFMKAKHKRNTIATLAMPLCLSGVPHPLHSYHRATRVIVEQKRGVVVPQSAAARSSRRRIDRVRCHGEACEARRSNLESHVRRGRDRFARNDGG